MERRSDDDFGEEDNGNRLFHRRQVGSVAEETRRYFNTNAGGIEYFSPLEERRVSPRLMIVRQIWRTESSRTESRIKCPNYPLIHPL